MGFLSYITSSLGYTIFALNESLHPSKMNFTTSFCKMSLPMGFMSYISSLGYTIFALKELFASFKNEFSSARFSRSTYVNDQSSTTWDHICVGQIEYTLLVSTIGRISVLSLYNTMLLVGKNQGRTQGAPPPPKMGKTNDFFFA